eukprot:gnl/TRDRNA2_/TRDRNA2_159808_c0_seq1.p1 gnl/TRDRNA2_/TRDRNA2_159808_c0~~gnl/TRDRNA2_/TRDRNA2_159808_c0_seq1.p1  ORF type:complete len:396 (-),score=46.58 gnl/TRDRNA2_/TRDRNA2_159808_c0_seq1:101-1288(-)
MAQPFKATLIFGLWSCYATSTTLIRFEKKMVTADETANAQNRTWRVPSHTDHKVVVDAAGHMSATQLRLHQDCSKTAPRRLQLPQSPIVAMPTSKIVYGVMANNLTTGRQQLKAQMETWAANLIKENRFFAIIGMAQAQTHLSSTDVLGQDWDGPLIAAPCADDVLIDTGLWACKEAHLLKGGFERGADWFVILGDDNYVDVERLETAILKEQKTDHPLALGIVGCGMGVYDCVEKEGGFCGGAGYMMNSAALRSLFDQGWEQLRKEYTDKFQAQDYPGDVASSCALRQRGIELRPLRGLSSFSFTRMETHQAMIKQGALTYHYLTADAMRWYHANLHHWSQDDIRLLEAKAFHHGCCCWVDQQQKDLCLSPTYQEISINTTDLGEISDVISLMA